MKRLFKAWMIFLIMMMVGGELYAASLEYSPNGATGGVTPTTVFDNSDEEAWQYLIAYNEGELTRSGYVFVGWNTQADGSGEQYLPESTYFTVEPEAILYAQWAQNSYTLSFEVNGGSSVSAITGTYNTEIVLPLPTRTGYAFNRWNSSPTFDGLGFAAESTGNLTADGTLYAEWATNNYVIFFDTQGGSDLDYIIYPFLAEVDLPTAPIKTGYTFAGWSPSAPETMPAEDVTLTAQWSTNNYTIVFDSNGGAEISQTVTRNYQAVFGELPIPTRVGYVFQGWTLNLESLPETMPAENIELTATWEAKNYTNIESLTEMDSGEEVETEETTIQENQTLIIPQGARLTTVSLSSLGSIVVRGSLDANTISVAGQLTNDGNLLSRSAITVGAEGRFIASANSNITIHHTPDSQNEFNPGGIRVQTVSVGTLVADGTLTVVLNGDVLDQPSYTFQIFEAEIESEFDTVVLPELSSGYFWDSSKLYTEGTLSIIGNQTGLTSRPLNYPNPFKWAEGTYIGYTLNGGAHDTELRVYTIRGQEVYRKIFTANTEEGAKPGYNKVQISPTLTSDKWSAGVYPYLIIQNGNVIGRGRMVVIP